MSTTESPFQPPAIFTRLGEVMGDVKEVAKRDRMIERGSVKYEFRGIDAVLNAVGPALRERRVLVQPKLLTIDRQTVEVGQNRTPMSLVEVQVRYTFVSAEDGSTYEVEVPGEAFDSGDKATSKAMSVAYRIALIQTFALPTDSPDPDQEAHQLAPAGPPAGCDAESLMERIRLAEDEDTLNRVATIATRYYSGEANRETLGMIRDATVARRKAIRETSKDGEK